MTITRYLPAVLLVALGAAEPVAAQTRMPAYSPPGRAAGMAPSVQPGGTDDPGVPVARPPSPARTLERMTTATPAEAAPAEPYSSLTGQPVPGAQPGGLPLGSYTSPYYKDYPACCGPLGGGPMAYELYVMTGPNFVGGNGPLTDRLDTGWIVHGGGRSLFFNTAADAAWVIDLGLSYQYNRGTQDEPADLFVRQAASQNQVTGQLTPQPDLFLSTNIRGFHRTAFNFAIGRDWWFRGPAAPGLCNGWNFRFGMDVGGRWGTQHVDLDLVGTTGPFDSPIYARRQGVFHGVYVSGHISWEVPVGGWVWFAGLRGQWGWDWGDVVPPLNGDIQNMNLLITTGIRF